MSSQIREDRAFYYNILERTQKGVLDVTDWLDWYLGCLDRAFNGAEIILRKVLQKARFWESCRSHAFNGRQTQILSHPLDGFIGKLTSSRWAKLTTCSPDTALRDINDLMKEQGGGRSTSYVLAEGHSNHTLSPTIEVQNNALQGINLIKIK